jgi:hypothetical protein
LDKKIELDRPQPPPPMIKTGVSMRVDMVIPYECD